MADSTTLPHRPPTLVIEVAKDEWIAFFAEFTRQFRGAHATLEVVGPEVGDQIQTGDRLFDGVAADVKDLERTVWIMFGTPPGDHFQHGIHNVKEVRMLRPAGRYGAVLEFEGEDQVKTLLELTRPEDYALPPGQTEEPLPKRRKK